MTVDHILELFERCKTKQIDPLKQRLVEADRLFYGMNERKERNEKQAMRIYEELSYDLPEARSMCLAVYHYKLLLLEEEDGPEASVYRRQISEITIRQVSNKHFTPIVLYRLSLFDEIPDLPCHVFKKIDTAFKLAQKYMPLRTNVDKRKKIIDCSKCERPFYGMFAIKCEFFDAPFCSVECQIAQFICKVFDGYYFGYSPKAVESLSFPEDADLVEYLDLNDPARLVEHFKVKTLLKPGYQTYLKRSVKEKAFRKCAILMRDPLTEFSIRPFEFSPEIPIRSLWCQSALLLAQFHKEPTENTIQMLHGNCLFLLLSGVLSCLDEEEALEAYEDVSNILDLAIDADEKLSYVKVFYIFIVDRFIIPSPSIPRYFVFAPSRKKRKQRRLRSSKLLSKPPRSRLSTAMNSQIRVVL